MIIESPAELSDDQLVADICVIGAGAAGIILAQELSASSALSTLVLEAGGMSFSPGVQKAYRGAASGILEQLGRPYVSTSRLRFFGGTTNHWGGMCRELDPLDFEKREWVPLSGWPFSKRELAEYYPTAAKYCGIAPFDEVSEAVDRSDVVHFRQNDGRGYVTKAFHLCRPLFTFRQRYKEEVEALGNVRVLLNTALTRIETDENAARVTGIETVGIDGTKRTIRAKQYVLACGALENARLLLSSDHVQQSGLGNGSGMVGRCFMEHPEVKAAQLVTWQPERLAGYPVIGGETTFRVLAPTAAEQQRSRLNNFCVQLTRPKAISRTEAAQAEAALSFGAPSGARLMKSDLHIRLEQSPNRESRITLISEKDRFGMRRIRLHWAFRPEDGESLLRAVRSLGACFGGSGIGRLRTIIDPDEPWRNVIVSSHHMGTTRMAEHPNEGVVDRHCRVFGIANLYVAGSSLFPAAGYANPTLTLSALALRLAEHLRST